MFDQRYVNSQSHPWVSTFTKFQNGVSLLFIVQDKWFVHKLNSLVYNWQFTFAPESLKTMTDGLGVVFLFSRWRQLQSDLYHINWDKIGTWWIYFMSLASRHSKRSWHFSSIVVLLSGSLYQYPTSGGCPPLHAEYTPLTDTSLPFSPSSGTTTTLPSDFWISNPTSV